MIRSRLWLTCAAMHDPVSPTLVKPQVIGWQAKKRRVDLTIERGFSGLELLQRMKGWVTTDPKQVAEVLAPRGRLKILDEIELVWECETEEEFAEAAAQLEQEFGDQVNLERLN